MTISMEACSIFLPKNTLRQKSFQQGNECALLKNTHLNDVQEGGVFYHCASLSHSNSRVSDSTDLIAFLSLKKDVVKPQFSNPAGKMTQSQEIVSAILRLLKATPSHPWGKEVGNPTADIQPIRKSSWLCLQNTSRIRSLTPPPPLPLWVKELRTAI